MELQTKLIMLAVAIFLIVIVGIIAYRLTHLGPNDTVEYPTTNVCTRKTCGNL